MNNNSAAMAESNIDSNNVQCDGFFYHTQDI